MGACQQISIVCQTDQANLYQNQLEQLSNNYYFIQKFYNNNKHLISSIKEFDFGFRLERKLKGLGFFQIYKNLKEEYEHCFHGTQLCNVKSILSTGLKIPGSLDANGNVIGIPQGHIREGQTISGVENWANAIFISPSPFYASDPVYSEHILSDNKKYCVVIEVFLQNKSQNNRYESTVLQREFQSLGEENLVEIRLDDILKEESQNIFDSFESFQPILTASLLFLNYQILQNTTNYQQYIYMIQQSLYK